jgi:predicted  nucleic acid-binding Zn-ribbon protein
MSLAGQLYKLQQLDLKLRITQQELDEIEHQLSDNKALVAAESELASQGAKLQDARKKQKDSEWELEDLQEKIRQIEKRLYGSQTKDPKELVNLEKESRSLRSQVKIKEDALLGLMGQVEETEAKSKTSAEEAERLKRDWEQRQEIFAPKKSEIEVTLTRLRSERAGVASQTDPEAFGIYERIRLARGQAVVKVEKGRCLGCNITVATSQWQKARAGELIQCNNCGRILYLE